MSSGVNRWVNKRTNQTKQAHNRAEHLNDEDLDEKLRVGSVGQRGIRAGDSDSDTTQQVAQAYCQTSPEGRKALRMGIRTCKTMSDLEARLPV